MANEEINKTKVLVKVYEPLIAILQHKIDAACLKRDAYLDKALRIEAEFLRKEVSTPNSDKAKNYIATQLSDLRLKPLNLLLSTETVELINAVCQEKNIPRDAFMNRFFLLLIASDAVLTTLFYEFLEEHGLETMEELLDGELSSFGDFDLDNTIRLQFLLTIHHNVLDSIEELIREVTPFFRIRRFIKYVLDNPDSQTMHHYYDAMYSYPFKKDALQTLPDVYSFLKTDNCLGFNTFMTDEQIVKQQTLDADLHNGISKKSEQDKLLAYLLKEKQLKAEKAKKSSQAKLEKVAEESTGDAK